MVYFHSVFIIDICYIALTTILKTYRLDQLSIPKYDAYNLYENNNFTQGYGLWDLTWFAWL